MTSNTGPERTVRTPSYRFGMAALLGLLLAIPLFSVYLLVYDRESQSQTAHDSIVEGWGEPQRLAGPYLVIPFSKKVETVAEENGKVLRHTQTEDHELFIAASTVSFESELMPELRRRSIYQAIVYTATVHAAGRFYLPNLADVDIDPATLRLDKAEIRFGISSAKGFGGSQPAVKVSGRPISLMPGSALSNTGGSGFKGYIGAPPIAGQPVEFDIAFSMRGNDSLSLTPSAGDTHWQAQSSWPSPSFVGDFLPDTHTVDANGFTADWRIGNFALNRPLFTIDNTDGLAAEIYSDGRAVQTDRATVTLLNPVDAYAQVNRAVKYGFIFIGFTFLTLLMFDVIGGVPVAGVAYMLVGSGLILFFVILLAVAEVLGFTTAYLIASAAIIGLISCYSAAVLRSWRRATVVAGLLIALYAILYILLSLEGYAILIGSLLLFVALAAVMYFTRNIDWRRGAGV